jgi:hypothetical protein
MDQTGGGKEYRRCGDRLGGVKIDVDEAAGGFAQEQADVLGAAAEVAI